MMAAVGFFVASVGNAFGLAVGTLLGERVGLPEGPVEGDTVLSQQLRKRPLSLGQQFVPAPKPLSAQRVCAEHAAPAEGDDEGNTLGLALGALVLGLSEGELEGNLVGEDVGELDGLVLGVALGLSEGLALGFALGLLLG